MKLSKISEIEASGWNWTIRGEIERNW